MSHCPQFLIIKVFSLRYILNILNPIHLHLKSSMLILKTCSFLEDGHQIFTFFLKSTGSEDTALTHHTWLTVHRADLRHLWLTESVKNVKCKYKAVMSYYPFTKQQALIFSDVWHWWLVSFLLLPSIITFNLDSSMTHVICWFYNPSICK